jgi:hypothetical protein
MLVLLFAGAFLFPYGATAQSSSTCPSEASPGVLSNGAAANGNTHNSDACFFAIDVPPGQLALKIEELTGTSTERCLLVQADSPPTMGGYSESCGLGSQGDCRQSGSGRLTCNFQNPQVGRWWIAVANADSSDTSTDSFTIQAAYSQGSNCRQESDPLLLTSSTRVGAATAGSAGGESAPASSGRKEKKPGRIGGWLGGWSRVRRPGLGPDDGVAAEESSVSVGRPIGGSVRGRDAARRGACALSRWGVPRPCADFGRIFCPSI